MMMMVDLDRRISMIVVVVVVFLMFQHIQFVTQQELVALTNHHHHLQDLDQKNFIFLKFGNYKILITYQDLMEHYLHNEMVRRIHNLFVHQVLMVINFLVKCLKINDLFQKYFSMKYLIYLHQYQTFYLMLFLMNLMIKSITNKKQTLIIIELIQMIDRNFLIQIEP